MTHSPNSTTRPSAREAANQKRQIRKQQESLLKDLLSVADALDRAADHWQQAKNNHQSKRAEPSTVWQRLKAVFRPATPTAASDNLQETVTSAQEGIELIRETMISVLNKHQVVPLLAKGEAFDPETMHALGQTEASEVSPNTVVEEIVRGYRWKERILREAQVIVAARVDSSSEDMPDEREKVREK